MSFILFHVICWNKNLSNGTGTNLKLQCGKYTVSNFADTNNNVCLSIARKVTIERNYPKELCKKVYGTLVLLDWLV